MLGLFFTMAFSVSSHRLLCCDIKKKKKKKPTNVKLILPPNIVDKALPPNIGDGSENVSPTLIEVCL